MFFDIFKSLTYNAALLLALAIVYDILVTREFDGRKKGKVYAGLILGVIALAIMSSAWVMQPGIVFDARTILFSLGAMFFGPIPAIISGLMGIAFRILMGGGGVYAGVSTIISSILWGLLWRHLHKRRESPYSFLELYQLGVLNHISMIVLMILAPNEIKWQIIHVVSVPILVIFPLATVVLGKILARRIQRLQVKQTLETSEQQYRLLAETTKDMIILHDISGDVHYANKMTIDFFGLKSVKEEKLSILDFVLPEYHQMLRSYAQERRGGLAGGRIYIIQVWDAQKQIKTLEVNSTTLSGEKQDTHLLAAMRDITDRMHNEEQKERYATRLEVLRELDRIVLENLPFEQTCNAAIKKLQTLIPFKVLMVSSIKNERIRFLALHKPEIRHRYLNTKDHFPLNPTFKQQLHSTHNFVIPDTSLLIEEKSMPIRAALIKEGMQSFMYSAIMAQNELEGFLWFASDKKDAFEEKHLEVAKEFADQLTIVLHQLELIKESKNHAREMAKQVSLRTDQLKHIMKELESFSYLVEHDLHAPLKKINGYTTALEEAYEGQLQPEAKEILLGIRAMAARMDEVIRELLRLSRENNKTVQKEKLKMRDIIQRQLSNVPQHFSVKVDSLLPCYGDAALIELVWKYLIENAVKFTLPAATHEAHIGCELKDDMVIYFIRDSGVGFDPALKEKIFDPFQKLHSPEEFKGSGSGLAQAKKIILYHDGEIWANSVPGEGSTFYFSLPYTVPELA